MKKLIFKLGILGTTVLSTLLNCTSGDDSTGNINNPTGEVYQLINDGELNGEIESNTTLDASVAYNLTGIFTVAEGATLTIPAGTTITANADDSTQNYIHINQGATINIEGEVDNPVIMTSTNGATGEWGGLIITGYAETTAGINAVAEVGNLTYGGSNSTDNSGSIKNLVIIGSGAIITDDSQFNGLSLYAVGSGTTIENIAIVNGEDDGVEFFGGSAEVTNLYIENTTDDAIDWTEGWNGAVTNVFINHNSAFSTAIEADGINNNPTLNNIMAYNATGEEGIALQFKSTSGATIEGLSLISYTTQFDFPDTSTEANVIIDGEAANNTTNYSSSSVDFSTIDFLFEYILAL